MHLDIGGDILFAEEDTFCRDRQDMSNLLLDPFMDIALNVNMECKSPGCTGHLRRSVRRGLVDFCLRIIHCFPWRCEDCSVREFHFKRQ